MRIITLIFALFLVWPAFSKTVIFLGDSLTEGYGIAREKSYPQLLLKRLQKEGYSKLKFINGSIAGSTTASAVSRFKWFLKANPKILVLALGANDGLRGLDIKSVFTNLSQVVKLAQKNGLQVILVGVRVPPNYGKAYINKFEKIFLDLATQYKLLFIPHLLKGVAGKKSLNQEDGIHPNEQGHQIIMKNIYPYLKKLL